MKTQPPLHTPARTRELPLMACLSVCAELVDLAPDLTDDLLNTVDQPLQVAKDAQKNVYLLCDYNRDGDSYRSPWTNAYDPQMDDGVLPPPKLRAMEVTANELFASYMTNYYENGASSVYFWELDQTAFAACVLFKKDVEQKKKGLESGGWDAIHVIEVRARRARSSAAAVRRLALPRAPRAVPRVATMASCHRTRLGLIGRGAADEPSCHCGRLLSSAHAFTLEN